MISIIICSRTPDISQSLKDNIAETIGVEYELIAIDNSKNEYSIFSAYNEGVRRSKGDILCFMHDDVLYHTNNWGEKVIKHFNEEQIGLIGIVGTHFLPHTASGWYWTRVNSGGCIQRFLIDSKHYESKVHIDLSRMNGQTSIRAVAVDGMWFCIPKSIFKSVLFDERTFTGYHCYDLDICLQIIKNGMHVHIVSDIILEHASCGDWTPEWSKNSLLLFEKWENSLPQIAGAQISNYEISIREEMAEDVFTWMSAYAQCNAELQNIRRSKAYKLGKFILKPISLMKKKQRSCNQ